MDKTVMFAAAGSGKTTYIVNSLAPDKRSLIVTYTINNRDNLQERILRKFGGNWPENVTLMTFFPFLYNFCYKPFLSDKIKAKGIIYAPNLDRQFTQEQLGYYLTSGRYFYSNRLSLFIEKAGILGDVKDRLISYFDEFIIDEVQDIAGRDFSFLELLMETDINMLFVGDFYQHTYDTSRDGNVNQSLFNSKALYEARFSNKGVSVDNTTLVNSWRCKEAICDFVTNQLGITIMSNRESADGGYIGMISDSTIKQRILADRSITKLHYQNSHLYGAGHKNWGDTKGEDCYQDICVMLNKTTAKKFTKTDLCSLAPSTRNKLYVAITRAHGNCYFIEE